MALKLLFSLSCLPSKRVNSLSSWHETVKCLFHIPIFSVSHCRHDECVTEITVGGHLMIILFNAKIFPVKCCWTPWRRRFYDSPRQSISLYSTSCCEVLPIQSLTVLHVVLNEASLANNFKSCVPTAVQADNASASLLNPGIDSFNWRHSKPRCALWTLINMKLDAF